MEKPYVYKGSNFQIKVTKQCKYPCLEDKDKRRIKQWIEKQDISEEEKHSVCCGIYNFLKTPKQKRFQCVEELAYDYGRYSFVRVLSKKNKKYFEAEEPACKAIARWLQKNNILSNNVDSALRVMNYGSYFVLQTKDEQPYTSLAKTEERLSLLTQHNIVALGKLDENNEFSDQSYALTSIPLRFKFKTISS